MSIRIKLPLLVLGALLFNILLLYGYFNLFLSKEISQYNSSMLVQLQTEADQISNEINNNQSYKQVLQDISETKKLIVQVIDESGMAVFQAGNDTGVNMEINASSLFHHDNHIYLLKVIQPLSLKKISSYYVVWNLFIAEIFIICIILLLFTVIIYFNYVRPIVALEKSMESYKNGIRPQNIVRKDEIGLLHNRFVKLTEVIENEKQKQNLIIASISHDIKTPLTSIMGFTERLKKHALPADKHKQYVDIIYNKAVSINNMIEEFDEFLNINGQSELKQQRVSVEKFCAIIKSDYAEELIEIGVAFSVKVSCPNEILFIDISKMRRVFGNIISNSLKYFGQAAPAIDIFCSKENDTILFSVEDNGKGISREDMQKIFDPFYTTDKSRSVAGLGLSICKEIVEGCGGRIWAENSSSGGAAIRISLPAM